VQQQFDMAALLAREIDAAQAMTVQRVRPAARDDGPETGELYTPDDFSVIDWNDEGTAMLQDAVWADTARLEDAEYRDTAVRFLRASMRGWMFCRDEHDACVAHVLDAGPTLGESHQSWQVAETNKLIWPSPGGIGVMDEALWDQTVEVAVEQGIIPAEPDEDAYTAELAEEALEGSRVTHREGLRGAGGRAAGGWRVAEARTVRRRCGGAPPAADPTPQRGRWMWRLTTFSSAPGPRGR
jgi:NitT/TauT family transport system substrate-binding protein